MQDALRAANVRGAMIRYESRLTSRFAVMMRMGLSRVLGRFEGSWARAWMEELQLADMRAGMPAIEDVEHLRAFIGGQFERAYILSQPPHVWSNPSVARLARNIFRNIEDSGLRPGQAGRAFMDAVREEMASYAPNMQQAALRNQSLQAIVDPLPDTARRAMSPQFLAGIERGSTGAGGFWGWMRRTLETNGSVDTALARQFAFDFVHFIWVPLAGGAFLAGDTVAIFDLRNWALGVVTHTLEAPDGVAELLAPLSATIQNVDTGHAEAEDLLARYQNDMTMLEEDRVMEGRCRGTIEPHLVMCAAAEGRANILAEITNHRATVNADMNEVLMSVSDGSAGISSPEDFLRGIEGLSMHAAIPQ
jgi:hypothetical protein